MKLSYSLFAVATLAASASTFAIDDSAKIPAPSVPLPPAAQVQPQPTESPSAPAVVVPPASQKTAAATDCPTEVGSRIRSASCNASVVRSYSNDELSRTGETNLGAALSKLDPSVNYRGAREPAGFCGLIEHARNRQAERIDARIEVFAVGRHHLKTAVHGADRCRQRAAAGVLEFLARL
ncbi:MAG: hypothetical protein JWR16_733 [Nevskia sp.]|nr:hypothetical protein [Nevskia sp.]